MVRLRWFGVALVFLGACAGAQQAYTVHAVVTGGKGEPVANLPQTAFTLLANGSAVPIQAFRAGDTPPDKVLIVIDAVNTSYTQVANERTQLEKFLTAKDGVLAQPTSLVIVADTNVQGTPGFTTNGNDLNASLQKQTVSLRDLRRSAGFYGAEERLDISLKALGQVLQVAGATPGHKLVLWISPGWPLLSGPGIELTGKQQQALYQEVVGLSAAIHNANVTLYSIDPIGAVEGVGRQFYYKQFTGGVKKPSQVQIGNLGVQVLAVGSGGLTLNGNNDIAAMVRECVADAEAPYTLSFVPPPVEPGHAYERLEIRLNDGSLKGRTAEGLYPIADGGR